MRTIAWVSLMAGTITWLLAYNSSRRWSLAFLATIIHFSLTDEQKWHKRQPVITGVLALTIGISLGYLGSHYQ